MLAYARNSVPDSISLAALLMESVVPFRVHSEGEESMATKSKKADNKIQGSGGDQGGRSKGRSKKEEGRKSSGNKKSGT
jgi:hypothetical protein